MGRFKQESLKNLHFVVLVTFMQPKKMLLRLYKSSSQIVKFLRELLFNAKKTCCDLISWTVQKDNCSFLVQVPSVCRWTFQCPENDRHDLGKKIYWTMKFMCFLMD